MQCNINVGSPSCVLLDYRKTLNVFYEIRECPIIVWIYFPRLNLPTKLYIINSKAMTVIELYGILDPITRDWTDGVLSNIFREINRPTEKKERRYGVIF